MLKEEFRSKSFLQFALEEAKSLAFILISAWMIFIGGFVSYQIHNFTPLAIMIFAGFGRLFYIVNKYYRFYTLGREYSGRVRNAIILEDIKFSSETKNVFFRRHPKYFHANKADIVIGKTFMLLLAKDSTLGLKRYWEPVEIFRLSPKLRIHNAIIRSSEKVFKGKSEYLKIEIKDEYYQQPIFISFKTHSEEIYNFLKDSTLETQHSQFKTQHY